MRKKHFLLTAAVLCGLFLLCQFLLHDYTAVKPVSAVIWDIVGYIIDCVDTFEQIMHLIS